MQLLIVISYDLLYFYGISSDVSSFISDIIYLISLGSLAKGLPIFLSLQKLFVSFFSYWFLGSISFIFALIFVISFLLITLCLVCSPFSMCKGRFYISHFLFHNIGIYNSKLPSKSSFSCTPYIYISYFSLLCFYFCFSQDTMISTFISSPTHWLCRSMPFDPTYLSIFLLLLIFSFILLGYGLNILKFAKTYFVAWHMIYHGKCFICTLEESIFSCFWVECSVCLLGSFVLWCYSRLHFPYWFSLWRIYPFLKVNVEVAPYYYCIAVYFFL